MFSRAEAFAVSMLALLSIAMLGAYLADIARLPLHSYIVVTSAFVLAVGVNNSLVRTRRNGSDDLMAFAAVVLAVFGLLLWLSAPALLPIGSGGDLAHHLMLVDYIERTHHLVRNPALGARLGEMASYTPGFHLLVVLLASVARTDAFHMVYPVIALLVALKAGLVFLIAARLVPQTDARVPLAFASVFLLFFPTAYFLGSFADHSFLAQVAAEPFAVGMWWAIIAWDHEPSATSAAVYALAGIATLLTWPIWVGPPLVTLAIVGWLRHDVSAARRLRHLAIACSPIAIVALAHAIGRMGAAVTMAGTSGFSIRPGPATLGWFFLAVGLPGTLVSAFDRRARTIAFLAFAIVLQAAALFLVARSRHAETPYLALKMFYLLTYPMAVAGALFVAGIVDTAVRLSRGFTRPYAGRIAAWTATIMLGLGAAAHVARMPRRPPVVSDALYDAGRWTRAHLPADCVDYLVANADTAYWLHLAVLGNMRGAARSLDSDTYEPQQALVRWILPEGLPYAIVEDLDALPRDIRTDVIVAGRFGRAAIVQRPGRLTCIR